MHANMAAICFILRANGQEILLMKHHQNSFAAGRWSVIGGKAETGETPEETVLREVREETGLTLTEHRQAGHLLLYGAAGDVTALSLFVATGHEGAIRGTDEGEPVWWPLSEVDRLNLVGYLRPMLPLVLAPASWLTGTIRISRDQEPVHWELDRHRIAESVRLEG